MTDTILAVAQWGGALWMLSWGILASTSNGRSLVLLRLMPGLFGVIQLIGLLK